MTEEFVDGTPGSTRVGSVGSQLRAAREKLGLTIEQVAAETRIPQRHLERIEVGDFAALPARTYAVGFSRNYAKLVGLNDDDVVDMVRAELDAQEPSQRPRPATFEPGDPARVPSRSLAWVSILAVVLVLAGLYFAARTFFAPAAELPSLVEQEQQEREAAEVAAREKAQAEGANPAAAATGPVVFTSQEEGVWVKFYDATGAQLMQKLMAKGETYTVPADANGPQIWTGRPDALTITIGGRPVARLAEDDMVMKDVPVSAQALSARALPQPSVTAPATSAATAPAAAVPAAVPPRTGPAPSASPTA